jgi:zinc protease
VQANLSDNYFAELTGKINGLTTADVAEAGKAVVDPERVIWLIVGDRKKIEAGIQELNLGEIEYIDSDGQATRGLDGSLAKKR